ncbi:hypothetical protein [Selenomonas ruminantium]|uniref:hypothetical protein n=1 Tax=Selenomonas ruminantium TaxID=971 RepID=UPI0026EA999C|nr:hypothetical protein [Selenomonas ruminantium]
MESKKKYKNFIQTTRSYLKHLRQFRIATENMREQLALWRKELQDIDAFIAAPIAQYGGGTGHGTAELNSVEAAAARREKLLPCIERTEKELDKVEHIINTIGRSMTVLDTEELLLLEGHYIKGQSWREISDNLYISEKWAAEKGGRAIKKLAEAMFADMVSRHQLSFIFAS